MHIRDKHLGLLEILAATGDKTLLTRWNLQKQVRTRASKTGVLYCQEMCSLLVLSASFYYHSFLLVQKNTLLNFSEILLIPNNKKSKLKYQRMIKNDHY